VGWCSEGRALLACLSGAEQAAPVLCRYIEVDVDVASTPAVSYIVKMVQVSS